MKENQKILYLDDFGDRWEPLVGFEGEYKKRSGKHPICLAGECVCPPEAVGGISGFEAFLSIIKNLIYQEHKKFLNRVGGKYDPEKFDPKKVKLDNPKSEVM